MAQQTSALFFKYWQSPHPLFSFSRSIFSLNAVNALCLLSTVLKAFITINPSGYSKKIKVKQVSRIQRAASIFSSNIHFNCNFSRCCSRMKKKSLHSSADHKILYIYFTWSALWRGTLTCSVLDYTCTGLASKPQIANMNLMFYEWSSMALQLSH